MFNTATFQASLVDPGELKYSSSSNNAYLRISVVKNYSERQKDGTYNNLPPIYLNLTLFGKQAELFAKSNIPKGSPLIIMVDINARLKPAYTSQKTGIEYAEAVEEQYNVKAIGPLIGYGRATSSFWPDKQKKTITQETSEQTKTTQSSTTSEDVFVDSSDEIFNNKDFSLSENSNDSKDEYDDLFA